MSRLFEYYRLVIESKLFDADFYGETYPEVATSGMDMLLHYLEQGTHLDFRPNPHFDPVAYRALHSLDGDLADYPLIHLIKALTGRDEQPTDAFDAGHEMPEHLLYLDVPLISRGELSTPVRGGLTLAGWAMAVSGVSEIAIAVDEHPLCVARYGIRRPDVAAQYPERAGAMHSGFFVSLPPKAFPPGRHVVSVTLKDHAGGAARLQFFLHAEPVEERSGPWSLRRQVKQSELNFYHLQLRQRKSTPRLKLVVPCRLDEEGALRQTLKTLLIRDETFLQILVVIDDYAKAASLWQRMFHSDYRCGPDRLQVLSRTQVSRHLKQHVQTATRESKTYYGISMPGDLWAADAALQFALKIAADPRADFVYADERRLNPYTQCIEAYFKPDWSPDLLLATHYINRPWFARVALWQCAMAQPFNWFELDQYGLVLMLTRQSRHIDHISQVLCETESSGNENALRSAPSFPASASHKASNQSITVVISINAGCGRPPGLALKQFGQAGGRDLQLIAVAKSKRAAYRADVCTWAEVILHPKNNETYAALLTRAASKARSDYLLFVDDDLELQNLDWLASLLLPMEQSEVAVVGPHQIDEKQRLSHAGYVVGLDGTVHDALKGLAKDQPGYFGVATHSRNVLGISVKALLTRRHIFEQMAGFRHANPNIPMGLDYGLRVYRAGYRIVSTPSVKLQMVRERENPETAEGASACLLPSVSLPIVDPYYSRHFNQDTALFEIDPEPLQKVFAGSPLFDGKAIQRILVVKLDHIGDCVTSLPAIRKLKGSFPKAEITILCSSASSPIWDYEECVGGVIEFDFFHAHSSDGQQHVTDQQWRALALKLKPHNFDLAIDLRKQPETRPVLQHASAKYTAGFDYQGLFPWLDIALEWQEDVPLRPKRSHIADDLCALIANIEAASRDSLHTAKRIVAKPDVSTKLLLELGWPVNLFDKPVICIHPLAGAATRQWPMKNYSELVTRLLHEGTVHIALLGAQAEKPALQNIIKSQVNKRNVFNMAGLASLKILPELIKRSCLFIGNNSGPHHLAATLGVPVIGIHSGVADSIEWAPVGPKALAIRRDVNCAPCYIEKPENCPRNLDCLTNISVSDVLETLKGFDVP